MTASIERLRERLRNRDQLADISAGITIAVLLLIFLLAQIFGMEMIKKEEEQIVRLELRERTPPVKFAQKTETPKAQKAAGPPTPRASRAQTQPSPQPEQAKPKTQSADISSLVQNFNPKQFMQQTTATTRRSNPQQAQTNAMNPNLTRSTQSAMANNNLSVPVSSQPSAVPGGRSGAPSSSSTAVSTGGSSSQVGSVAGFSAGIAGGAGSGRATRSSGGGGGSASITMPGAGDGEEATLDINELIEWMKRNPGAIPKLVGYEMDHVERQDLSSAVTFTMQGKRYQLYLSCNEKDLLLRICLIEANDFTLLKDNGIRETSNFLTTGGVMREADAIQSLISSRRAPAGKAEAFYSIFWGWWEQERVKMR